MTCALGVAGATLATARASASPLTCTSGLIYSSTNTNSIRMVGSDGTDSIISSGQATLPNSIAFDPVDGNLYMLTANNNVLNIVQADGTVTSLGPVTGLPNTNYFGATFAPDGTLWLATSTANLWRVDMQTLTATSLTLSTTVTGDLTWVNGTLYATKGSALARINPSTGQVTTTSNVPNFSGLGTTGLWFLGGHFFANSGITLYEVFNYQTSTPTTILVRTMSVGPADGASCASAPSPFANAVDDDFSATLIRQHLGGTVGNVFSNDTINGTAVSAATATATVTADGGATGASIGADGTLTVPAGLTPGPYTLQYKMCEVANSSLCDAASVVFSVQAPDTLTVTNDDLTSPGVATSGGVAGNVLTNDTINGDPITADDVAVTLSNDGGLTGVSVAADGAVTVPSGATPGTYTLTYQLCQSVDPSNCGTATATVRVVPDLIVTSADHVTVPASGGSVNVLTNDTINGSPIDPTQVTLAVTDTGGLSGATIGADGTLTIPSGAAPGSYTVTYQVCERTDPGNCATAAVTVTVAAATSSPSGPSGTSAPAPAPAPTHSTSPGDATGGAVLAQTGAGAAEPAALIGALLLLLGFAIVLIARRRRPRRA